jgi:nucleoside-diphosphate-sugar epimerase
MHVLVTGATGFVGRHLVAELLTQGHQVTALARDPAKAKAMPWIDRVKWMTHDLHGEAALDYQNLGSPDAMIHLAWSGLPNYQELFHFEVNLPKDYSFISSLVKQGLPQVLITGTCLEYGLKNGPLSVDMPADPQTPYALAKHTLHMQLRQLQTKQPFTLQWARLFYMYGEGQSPKSILSQLVKAIESGEKKFNMSMGEQLRDYLHIKEVSMQLTGILLRPIVKIVNVCSGKPISVRSLVERQVGELGASIELDRGYYSYPSYEAMAFWGVN